jgi:hypothetical protein
MSEAADILYPSMAEAAQEPARAAPDTPPENILYPNQGKEEERPDAYETAPEEAPEAAVATYEDLAMPEGFQVDEVTSNDFMDLAGRIDINPTQAQALVNFQAEATKRQAEAWQKTEEGWKEEIHQDPEIGGENFNRSLTTAKGLIGQYGGPDLGDALDEMGVSNLPDFRRFLSRVGKALSV